MSIRSEASYESKIEFVNKLNKFIDNLDAGINQQILKGSFILKINDWIKPAEFEKTREFCKVLKGLEFFELRSLYCRVFTSFKLMFERNREKYLDFQKIMNVEDDLAYLLNDDEIALTVFLFVIKRQASLTKKIVESFKE